MQVAFNRRLESAGQKPLPYSNLTTSDTPLTKEEAEAYVKTVGSNATAEQAHVLYSHNIAPEERPYLKETLPKIDLHTVDIEELSLEQIYWCHKICVSKDPELSLEKYSDFANVFFSHNLSQPSVDYEINPALPSSAKDISSCQAAYYTNYYLKNPALQDTLTLNKRAVLYALFVKQGEPHFLPDLSTVEIPDLSKSALVIYKAYYQNNLDLWHTKTTSFQKAFNRALTANFSSEIPLTDRPKLTQKKIALLSLIIFVAVSSQKSFFTQDPPPLDSPLQQKDEPDDELFTCPAEYEEHPLFFEERQVTRAPQSECYWPSCFPQFSHFDNSTAILPDTIEGSTHFSSEPPTFEERQVTYAPKEACHFSHFDNSTVIPKETNEVLIPRDFHSEKAPINKYPSCPAIRSDLIPHPQFPGVKTKELYDVRALQGLKKETTDLPYSPLSAGEVENNSSPDRCEQKQALQVYTGGITPSWTETLDRVNNYSKRSDPFGTCAARVTRASQSFSLVYATVVASSLVAAVLAYIRSH